MSDSFTLHFFDLIFKNSPSKNIMFLNNQTIVEDSQVDMGKQAKKVEKVEIKGGGRL